MRDIDNKIKVITNRCQNELSPRLKALSLSEAQMNEDLNKVEQNLQSIIERLQILDQEMADVRDDFERTIQSLLPNEERALDEELDLKVDSLQS